MSEPLLELKSVSRSFGGIMAVKDVSLKVGQGEIVGLIGPNGAGKTSLVNLISGLMPVSSGTITFAGVETTGRSPDEIARRGIARTFQIVQPFAQMTVLENVMAGALFSGSASSVKEAAEKAHHYLAFARLDKFANNPASQLALANRKRLEFAKSLAMEPRLLMLDEVNAGLNSSEIDEALALIRSIAERGVTIIVIEHLMRVVTSLANRIFVLHHGALLSEGTAEEIFRDQRVIEAYLGSKYAQRHVKAPG